MVYADDWQESWWIRESVEELMNEWLNESILGIGK